MESIFIHSREYIKHLSKKYPVLHKATSLLKNFDRRQKNSTQQQEIPKEQPSEEKTADLLQKQQEQEDKRQRQIDRTVRLLAEEVIFGGALDDEPFEMRQVRRGVSPGKKILMDDDTVHQELHLYYRTATGKIRKPAIGEDFEEGEYSRVSTWVNIGELPIADRGLEDSGKMRWFPVFQIGLMQSLDRETADDEEGTGMLRRIVPQRLSTGEKWRLYEGRRVNWGQTYYKENPSGDSIIFESIEEFNRRFGKRN